jgi:hypothetical protein
MLKMAPIFGRNKIKPFWQEQAFDRIVSALLVFLTS